MPRPYLKANCVGFRYHGQHNLGSFLARPGNVFEQTLGS
jgi:hypothetical protein